MFLTCLNVKKKHQDYQKYKNGQKGFKTIMSKH